MSEYVIHMYELDNEMITNKFLNVYDTTKLVTMFKDKVIIDNTPIDIYVNNVVGYKYKKQHYCITFLINNGKSLFVNNLFVQMQKVDNVQILTNYKEVDDNMINLIYKVLDSLEKNISLQEHIIKHF